MKKQEVKNIENVATSVTNKVVKGCKAGKCETSNDLKATRKDSRAAFISFINSKEEIGLNKFFKLFQAFKTDSPAAFAEYLAARNMNGAIDYSFAWFKDNCPSLDGNFAKWVKVSEKIPANENEAYNRTTENGTRYTLVAYNCFRANWEQYERILNDVVADVKRREREQAARVAAEKKQKVAKEKAEKAAKDAAKQAATKAERIAKLQKELERLQTA